jgi:hypothetical protein
MPPSASLSEGVVFVARFPRGYRVREVAQLVGADRLGSGPGSVLLVGRVLGGGESALW